MTVKRKRAPDVRNTCAASVPLNRVFSGTSTPPAEYRPSAATIHWCMLGAHTDARSPGCRPVATNALAAVRTAASSPAKLSLVSRSTTASSSGQRPAARWTTPGTVSGSGMWVLTRRNIQSAA